MKAILLNKRFRFTVFGLLICFLAAAVWWSTLYTGLMEELDGLKSEQQVSLNRLERLQSKKEALWQENLVNREKQKDLQRLSNLLVGGNSAVDVNTEAQKLIRSFWDEHAIKLDTFREIPSGKWRDNVILKLNYQFTCELEDLSDLLNYFEKLEKVIRIETLNIHYLKREEDNLQVILTLGILSITNDVI
ncbi:MAG: hypothetical protein H8D87_05045 [Deltaproteobacteria bacterium]|uniref:hypothetical protein n=1 Tax=Desulfobacula sp. TaxID=2593537 RepID=UPI0019AD4AF5|nr:hypothetical protein [Candidatus Desulfobacula maris]MBL6994724.1 hypothetical protein [Desulfobacula sp.]